MTNTQTNTTLNARDILILGELFRWIKRNDTLLPTYLFIGLKDIVSKLKLQGGKCLTKTQTQTSNEQ